jgi:hypothetical protein
LDIHDDRPAAAAEHLAESNGSGDLAKPIAAGPGLPTAASIRKQRVRTLERKPIRISWEPADDGSDALLITIAILVFVFAVVVVGIALYFK